MIRVKVPATVANLGPGFDCLGMALEFYNAVEMYEIPSGLYIEVQGEGTELIPKNEQNIVYQAARRVFQKVGYTPAGLKIKLTNNVPVGKGLGSSASAIVGGIIAANVMSGKQLKEKDLLSLAAEIEGHPDNVAPALLGGIIVSVSLEGDIKYIKITPPSQLKCVVAVPDFCLSTKTSREALPQQVSFNDAVFNIGRVALLVASLQQGELGLLSVAMDDRMHQSYRSGLIPGMKKVMAAAKLAGARGVTLSGAGPTLIAFADNNMELISKVMKDTFRQNGIMAKVYILNPSPVGSMTLCCT
ncbi:homoserine kinase [Desulfofarcimen acetoxidans DSM 771]|uniref:Homoserine kinase n=1 Tax=Desulfofarcimen acetoxidans (strain ATCC 49208 / DSM 771 / KCTC 5769 / VKM B-1644 / 5575) TaxID=485916 RepID=C8VZ34_DESAS|nr:homoserine kinase [Desulfofarcimen acetoxidans]ACV62944.1 homoserine kinase [Desulfofarcimen acetoxidans DSM 771]